MSESEKSILNVGVIGAGAFMTRQHLPNIVRDPRYRIHTLCRRNEKLLAEVAKEFNPVRTTTDADELLEDPEIDVVFVGTRSDMHAHFLKKAADNSKHVYVEKPMTMNYEDTAKVLASVKEFGVTVGVGFNRRFAPIMVESKRMFQESRNGHANIIYRIVDDHDIRPKYIFDMETGGGHLLQEGCHIFDLIAWFLEEEPVEIYATGPLETDNVLIMKFADGSLATMLCGGKGGLFYPKECMEVFCSRTTLIIDHFFELRLDGPGRSLIKTFALDPKSTTEPEQDSMTGFYKTAFAQRPAHDVTDTAEANALHKLKPDKGHTEAIVAFADAVATGKTFAPGAIDGARATVCALKAYESIRANQPVAISPKEYGLE